MISDVDIKVFLNSPVWLYIFDEIKSELAAAVAELEQAPKDTIRHIDEKGTVGTIKGVEVLQGEINALKTILAIVDSITETKEDQQ
jgi:hypothetical protein